VALKVLLNVLGKIFTERCLNKKVEKIKKILLQKIFVFDIKRTGVSCVYAVL